MGSRALSATPGQLSLMAASGLDDGFGANPEAADFKHGLPLSAGSGHSVSGAAPPITAELRDYDLV